MKIVKIEPKGKSRIKRVAAYARVSTLYEEQEDSYETQLNYYTRLIKTTPNWEFIKVYSDHGVSGSSAQQRPGFMEMIKDGEAKKFDILLVKSISRFARNAKEAQDYVHLLKSYNIEVIFDREHISSFDPSAEMIFNILAAMAQEEIRTASERVKWSNKRLMERNIKHVGSNHLLGYDEINGKLVPNDSAWIIKRAFEYFVDGMTTGQIAKLLNEQGAKTLFGKSGFTATHIRNMLKTVIYVGDRHLQQEAPVNYLTHKPDYSQTYSSRYIQNDHEGIISRELWNKVQSILKQEAAGEKHGIRRRKDSHFLYGRVFCAECGSVYCRKFTRPKRQKGVRVWKCSEKEKGSKGKGCKNDNVLESDLLEAIAKATGNDAVDEETVKKLKIRVEIAGGEVRVMSEAKRICRHDETDGNLKPKPEIKWIDELTYEGRLQDKPNPWKQ